jgi:hypothetical protein
MKRFFLAAGLALGLAGLSESPTGAYTEISYEEYQILGFPCGSLEKGNESGQYGSYNWLQYTITTTGALDVCGQWFVGAAGSVSGVGGTSYGNSGILYASIQKQVPVPHYGTYTVNGAHSATTIAPTILVRLESQSPAEIRAPQAEPDPWETNCDDASECLEDGQSSPIIIDMGRNGYQLTGPEEGVWFDLDADGVPERLAWTRPESDDVFLAMDRNGNGRIDDGSELFGNHTPAFATGFDGTAANGFEALRFLEWGGYGDTVSPLHVNKVIDRHDAAFGRLLLWHDANHNGVSKPEELTPIDRAGIAAIMTDYVETRRRDRFGNQFRQRGKLSWLDGSHSPVFDVWLRR